MTTAAWEIERRDTLGARLRTLRLEFGLSANAAAMAVGAFDGQTWRNYEDGVTKKPAADSLWAVVQRFESRPDKAPLLFSWLMNGGPLPERPEPLVPFTRKALTSPPSQTDRRSKKGHSSTMAGQRPLFPNVVRNAVA